MALFFWREEADPFAIQKISTESAFQRERKNSDGDGDDDHGLRDP
jgi:hypothetical protein